MCECETLRSAYRRGREDAAIAVKDLIRQQLGYGKAEWIDDEDYAFIAAARGDGDCQHDWQHLKGEKCATCRRCGAARGEGEQT